MKLNYLDWRDSIVVRGHLVITLFLLQQSHSLLQFRPHDTHARLELFHIRHITVFVTDFAFIYENPPITFALFFIMQIVA